MVLNTLNKKIADTLRKYPVSKAAIFGSFAKGTQTKNSDIDILIEPSEPISLFTILQLENELGKIMKRRIDIVEYTAIKPSIKKSVLKDAISIL
jgi:predicted nucleotidyltransferase